MQQTPPNLSFWEKETFINHSHFIIIGSGIVGLSTAIYLKQRNLSKKVTVLEQGILPSGASTKNAGFACIGSPSELLADLEKNSENEVFKIVEKRWRGLARLRELLGDKNIDFQKLGSYELFGEVDNLVYEKCIANLQNLNSRLKDITGISEVFKDDKNIVKKNDFKGFENAISHEAEGQIDTGKMMNTLIQKANEVGVKILNGVSVNSIEKSKISTNLGDFSFEKCAICTNGFAKQFLPELDLNPARAQVLITKPIDNLKFKGIYHFDEGYYYFRNIGNRILFGGGRNLDFKAENTKEMVNTDLIVNHLESLLRNNIFPNNPVEIDYTWAGVMGVGAVKSPILQQVDENVFCGVRLGGMGVAIGTLVGEELGALILEE